MAESKRPGNPYSYAELQAEEKAKEDPKKVAMEAHRYFASGGVFERTRKDAIERVTSKSSAMRDNAPSRLTAGFDFGFRFINDLIRIQKKLSQDQRMLLPEQAFVELENYIKRVEGIVRNSKKSYEYRLDTVKAAYHLTVQIIEINQPLNPDVRLESDESQRLLDEASLAFKNAMTQFMNTVEPPAPVIVTPAPVAPKKSVETKAEAKAAAAPAAPVAPNENAEINAPAEQKEDAQAKSDLKKWGEFLVTSLVVIAALSIAGYYIVPAAFAAKAGAAAVIATDAPLSPGVGGAILGGMLGVFQRLSEIGQLPWPIRPSQNHPAQAADEKGQPQGPRV